MKKRVLLEWEEALYFSEPRFEGIVSQNARSHWSDGDF